MPQSLSLQNNDSLPKGIIGENSLFSWGYNGSFYYVAEGVFEFLVTKVHLSLDEAKQLYEALTFLEAQEPDGKVISSVIKKARSKKLSGDDLMWFLTDHLTSTTN